jgi:hypothetical protein
LTQIPTTEILSYANDKGQQLINAFLKWTKKIDDCNLLGRDAV